MSNILKEKDPKSAEIVEAYVEKVGITNINAIINLLLCHIEVYMREHDKEVKSQLNTIINLHVSSGLTILMKIVHNVIKATQATGEPKAEIYELRKQIAKILQNNAEHILSDEFYKFEDFIK